MCVHVDECLQELVVATCTRASVCVGSCGVYLCVLCLCACTHHFSLSALFSLLWASLPPPWSPGCSPALTKHPPHTCCGDTPNCRSAPIIPSLHIPLWLPWSLTFKFTLPGVTLESCSDPALCLPLTPFSACPVCSSLCPSSLCSDCPLPGMPFSPLFLLAGWLLSSFCLNLFIFSERKTLMCCSTY